MSSLVLLFASSVALSAAAQAGLPPLPRLALETYPAAARDAVARAHRDAVRRATDPAAVGTLARTLHAWEQWNSAHDAYARAQALAPNAFEWHYLDAIVLRRLARHGDSAARLEQALKISSNYLPARVMLAEESFAAGGHHDAAVPHLQRAITLFPEYGAAHYALALSYRALGRTDEARREIEKHTQFGPRWPAIEDPVLATVAALRDDPQTDLQRGLKLAEAGDLAGAIAAHEAALDRDPSIAQAHVNLISLYGRTQDWERAEHHYRAVVTLGFNLDEAHYDYGVLLGLRERWGPAAEAYRPPIASKPRHARAHNTLGQMRGRGRRFDEAAAAYRQAGDSQPAF